MRGVRFLVLGTFLYFLQSQSSVISFGTPAASQIPSREQWYISEVDHDHGQAQNEHADHAAHAPAVPRTWEPIREIDPSTMRQWQETYEVTRFPNQTQPTPGQRRQAEALIERSRESAARHGWFEYESAVKDGFTQLPLDDIHYVNAAYALDDVQLDPDRPEFLLFMDTPAGKRLAAFMFLTRGPDDHGEQVGGPLTIWHYHAWSKPVCLVERRIVAALADTYGRCTTGVPVNRSPEMMHVWLLKSAPGGPFSTSMTLTDEMRNELLQSDRR
jgi:hypothetical protein